MADDPFSIWGEPSISPTTTTKATNSNSKTSLDFFDSLATAAPSTSTSTSTSNPSIQPRPSSLINDSFDNDDATATWGQPSSPAPIPTKSQDQDLVIPDFDQISIQDQHESSLVQDQRQIPTHSNGRSLVKDQEEDTGRQKTKKGDDPQVQEVLNPTGSSHPTDSSQMEPFEDDEFHKMEPTDPTPEADTQMQESLKDPPADQPPSSISTLIAPPPVTSANPPPPDDDFDDFNGFGESGGNVVGEDDEEFGDFGDFDDGSLTKEEPEFQEEQVVQQQQQQPTNAANWSCLQVDLNSTSESVSAQVRELLSPPLAAGSKSYPYHDGSGDFLGNDKLRQVEGNSQVLVSEKSRQAFSQLSQLPSLQPISWTRSLTRRSSLISLGIPINLDEVSTSSSGMGGKSTLPPLALTLDSSVPKESGPNSAPASDSSRGQPKRSQSGLVPGGRNSNTNTPRTGSPAPGVSPGRNGERMAERRREELGLGPAPELDWKRAEELVALTEDQLTLQSLPALRSLSRELHALTTTSSSLLTHHLTLRESHSADAEMYDSMIRDLVAGASSRLSNDRSASKGDRRATIGLGTSSKSTRSTSGTGMVHSNSQQRMNGLGSSRPSSPAVNSPKR